MSKEKFRVLVKNKTKVIAIKDLNEQKNETQEIKPYNFWNLTPAEYLKSKNHSIEEVQTLYKLRFRMINVKQNFKSSHKENIWCRTCFLFPESQQHLTICSVIKSRMKHLINFNELDHQMIYQSLERQEKCTRNSLLILKAREEIISENEFSSWRWKYFIQVSLTLKDQKHEQSDARIQCNHFILYLWIINWLNWLKTTSILPINSILPTVSTDHPHTTTLSLPKSGYRQFRKHQNICHTKRYL